MNPFCKRIYGMNVPGTHFALKIETLAMIAGEEGGDWRGFGLKNWLSYLVLLYVVSKNYLN